MIFYFSGTGNSKWIAEEAAKQLNDEAVNIVEVKNKPYTFEEGQKVGLVFPVYAWGLPEIVLEFVRKINVCGAFVFAICTCGNETGYTMKKLAEVIPLNSAYSIPMPDGYIAILSVDSDEEIQRKIKNAKMRLDTICGEIREGVCKSEVAQGRHAFLKSNLGYYLFNRFGRSTKPFFAKECCSSCGLCEKVCPLKTIALKDGKPKWGKKCYQCFSCINRCPTQAIEYGKATIGKKRYYFKDYSV